MLKINWLLLVFIGVGANNMNMKNKGQNISPISAIFFEEYMSLGYTFVSNHIVHKNLNGVCFFNKICYLKGLMHQKQRPHKFL